MCVCIKWTHLLSSRQTWRKSDVKVIEYGGKIWINQGDLQGKLGIANIADRTQYYSNEFKKMTCEYKSGVNINLVECLLKILWQ